jgi:UDP-2-acetamido-2,6-beta-L-arabino-hexul-4-ose reductase
MIRIGITGQSGFIGSHLFNTIRLYSDKYSLVSFDKIAFKSNKEIDQFVSKCDVIVHLAGINRHVNQNLLYQDNLNITSSLISSLERTKRKPHVIFTSSTQEDRENLYGNSKKIAREMLIKWASDVNAIFTGLIVPNVFGPFCKPNYNSVVATFCKQLINNISPKIDIDAQLNLIYVGDLVKKIIQIIDDKIQSPFFVLEHGQTIKVSDLLFLLQRFKEDYHLNGVIPKLNSNFELQLFNTFRSYEILEEKYPVKYLKHSDLRGNFTELLRLNSGGQISFSTTNSGITRGNHFHTRKIERFSVIKGKARIQLRRIGTSQIFSFDLNGDEPSYVDMPVWYAHNLTNIGDSDLFTVFWINEHYDALDPDTFTEVV